jgi:chromosome segregation ATPase
MINSPLKGIEKLSEDLRVERQKANIALQDRARLRIEVESLKKTVEQLELSLQEWQNRCNNFESKNGELSKNLDSSKNYETSLLSELQAKLNENAILLDEKSSFQNELKLLQNIQAEKEIALNSSILKIESLEIRMKSKDETMNDLKNEIQSARRSLLSSEQTNLDLNQKFTKQSKMFEDLKSRFDVTEMLERSYSESQQSNELLREEISQQKKINTDLKQRIKEVSSAYADQTSRLLALEQAMSECEEARGRLEREAGEWEGVREEMARRSDAERDNAEAARGRAAAALRGREFLEQQVAELRSERENTFSRCSSLDEQLRQAKGALGALQGEWAAARERLAEAEAVRDQLAGMQAMVAEVDGLRQQLNDVRKQLIKRDIEDEAGSFAPRALIERESHGRKVGKYFL